MPLARDGSFQKGYEDCERELFREKITGLLEADE
jgi:hypothetical protein